MTSPYSPIDRINSYTSRFVNVSVKQYFSVTSINLRHFYSVVCCVRPKYVFANPVYGYSFHSTDAFRHIFFYVRLEIHSFDCATPKVTPIDIIVLYVHCNGKDPSNILRYNTRSGFPSGQVDTIYGIPNTIVQAWLFTRCEERRIANSKIIQDNWRMRSST